MANAADGSVWPRGYWRTWQPIVGATYATSLTKLRAWSNVVTTLLFVVATVMLAYYFLIARSGTLLTAVFVLLVPWAIAVGIIEWQRRRLAKTVQRNLAANGKPVGELPTFVDIQFLRWKQTHSVTTDELEATAPRSS
jgi:flagellin-like protein